MCKAVLRICVVFLVIPLLFSAALSSARAEGNAGRVFVATADWVPPVIDEEEALKNEPWLLVLKTAQEEIGYVEGPREDQSKYGEWFGDKYTAWCAEFLTWCVNTTDERYGTDLMKRVFPYYGHPRDGAPWFLQRERFVTSTSRVPVTGEEMWLIGMDRYLTNKEYIPYPGDYMWFAYYSPKKGTDHVAIVEGVSVEPDGSYLVHVIEGNNPDRVQRNTYELTWKLIYGYGTPVRRANRVIRIYNSNDDCRTILQYLFELGYLTEKNVTDNIQESGRQALRQYQKDHGISVTGKVDLETRTAMEDDPRFLELISASQR